MEKVETIVLYNGILSKAERRVLIEKFGEYIQVRYNPNFLDDFLGENLRSQIEKTQKQINVVFLSETNPYLVSQIVVRQDEKLKTYFLSYNDVVEITATPKKEKIRV